MGGRRTFDHDEARRLYAEGLTQTVIAERYGMALKTIQKVCRGVSAQTNRKGAVHRARLQHHNVQAIIDGLVRRQPVLELRNQGLSYTEIGLRIGISRARAHQIVATAGRVERAAPIVVPVWVPPFLKSIFIEIGARDGEEAAASHCRRLKAEAAASCR